MPQELTADAFETVWATVSFSRGLFGKPPNPAIIEKILRDLSLWDKKRQQAHDAVGRHEAAGADRQGARRTSRQILFLDEPTAGVDVELRRDMWSWCARFARAA